MNGLIIINYRSYDFIRGGAPDHVIELTIYERVQRLQVAMRIAYRSREEHSESCIHSYTARQVLLKMSRPQEIGSLEPEEKETRATPLTSVMPVSVTSHETVETITTYVNGRPVRKEEVTRIYVIEPVEEWRRTRLKETVGDDNLLKERRWMADVWLCIWAAWAAYLLYEWRS
jgi:hypothetical protein